MTVVEKDEKRMLNNLVNLIKQKREKQKEQIEQKQPQGGGKTNEQFKR